MTLDIFYLELPEGGWICKCEDHAAWRFKADTYEEEKGTTLGCRWGSDGR